MSAAAQPQVGSSARVGAESNLEWRLNEAKKDLRAAWRNVNYWKLRERDAEIKVMALQELMKAPIGARSPVAPSDEKSVNL